MVMGKENKTAFVGILAIGLIACDLVGFLLGSVINNKFTSIALPMFQPVAIVISMFTLPTILLVAKEKFEKEKTFSFILIKLAICTLIFYATTFDLIISSLDKIFNGMSKMWALNNILYIVGGALLAGLVAALFAALQYATKLHYHDRHPRPITIER
jgi:uncharacterized membrane protein YozB (DUF420 family)